jgi:hypothetical protein
MQPPHTKKILPAAKNSGLKVSLEEGSSVKIGETFQRDES